MPANRARNYLPIGFRREMVQLVAYAPDKKTGDVTVRRVIIRCDCGVEKEVSYHNLVGGMRSCGCSKRIMRAETISRRTAQAKAIFFENKYIEELRRNAEIKINADFKKKMDECEANFDTQTMLIETRKYLYSTPESWVLEKEKPDITVGDFVIDDNVIKFE